MTVDIKGYDHIFLIGVSAWEFRRFSQLINEHLSRPVSAICVDGIDAATVEQLFGGDVIVAHAVNILQKARRSKVLLIDFFSNFSGNQWARSLAAVIPPFLTAV